MIAAGADDVDGGVALFVSIFIIYNTFAIVLGQRIRELALLRTVGADPRQIKRSVLGEAFVVGMLASAGGIGGGIWLWVKLVVIPFVLFCQTIGWVVYVHHIAPEIRWWQYTSDPRNSSPSSAQRFAVTSRSSTARQSSS